MAFQDPLIRFGSDPTPDDLGTDTNTVWLYDSVEKIYYPFSDPQALRKFLKLGDAPQDNEKAFSYVKDIPTSVLSDSVWQGKFVSSQSSIKSDGVNNGLSLLPKNPEFNKSVNLPSVPIDNYGKQGSADADKLGVNFMGLLLTTAKNNGYISQSTFDKYAKDPSLLTRYSNAVTYGEYEPSFILKDIKAKELSDQGNTAYKNFKAFDENLPASQWRNTTEGQKVQSDSSLSIPPSLNISQDILNNPLFSIPAEAFKTLVPPIDWNSPEFKAEAEKIQASFYDIQMQKSEADTEQKKALADNNWKIFQENLKKKYGINLSNNARQAWKQLDDMFAGYSSRGLAKSGIFNEAMDKYLGDVRRQDKLKRETMMSDQDIQQREYLFNSGSTKDINDFAAKNPDKAKEWGLIPSSDMVTWLDKANLKKLYPDMSDAELDVIRGMFVDENGHYKSNLYQTLWANKYKFGEEKKTYQQQKLLEKKLLEEEKTYKPYTSGNPFSSFYNQINPISKTPPVEMPDPNKSLADITKFEDKGSPIQNPYDNLINRNGTIWNAKTNTGYQTPEQLAKDIGTTSDKIRWGDIKQESSPVQNPVPNPTIAPSALENIRKVFGSSWNPSSAFSNLKNKGVYGAVRVSDGTDPNKVYTIGDQSKWLDSPEAYKNLFNTYNQEGIVGLIDKNQAKALKLPGYY